MHKHDANLQTLTDETVQRKIKADDCKNWGFDLPVVKSPQAFSRFLMTHNLLDVSSSTDNWKNFSWCNKGKKICIKSHTNPLLQQGEDRPINMGHINFYGQDSAELAKVGHDFVTVLKQWDTEYRCEEV